MRLTTCRLLNPAGETYGVKIARFYVSVGVKHVNPLVLKLIEKHMLLWELRGHLEDYEKRPGRCFHAGIAYGPCLLLSRERGSGGGQIASKAGERLGWQVFDREILDEVAHLAHVRHQLTQTVDQQIRAQWEEGWEPELKPEDIGYETYLRYLREVVLTLGHHGSVVLVGRGAQYLLPERCALRVRVVAPLDLRVQRMAERGGFSMAEARAQVEEFDRERTDFVWTCFQRDANSPENYDLVINTRDISVEAAVETVLTAVRTKLGLHNNRAELARAA